MSQNTLLYRQLAAGTQYYNLVRDLSWMNSKNHEHSDRDGHVLGYLVNVKVMGESSNGLSFVTAPNTWKMRNAFRKWHAYRNMMLEDAGVTEEEKGRYGKTIRPYLDHFMPSGNVKDPSGWDLTSQTQEWTYTRIAATPGFDADAVGTEGQSAVDTYSLNICGPNQVDATTTLGTEYYDEVGMIHSYNQDRQEVTVPSGDETIAGHNNPLALLRYKGNAGGEVMDIVEEQEEELPPYDTVDSGWSTVPATADIMRINPGYDGTSSVPVIRTTTLFVPAGLLAITAENEDPNALVFCDVVGTVLCKDME